MMMIKINNTSKTHLFLIEMIIVLAFLSFACAIIIQVFAKADALSQQSLDLTGAVLAAQSAAELDKNKDWQQLDLAAQTVYFDKQWQQTDKDKAVYQLLTQTEMQARPTGTMLLYTYTIDSSADTNSKSIYQLQSKKYYSGIIANNPPVGGVGYE
jgi:type II secretory pathway pseudopilin PulG